MENGDLSRLKDSLIKHDVSFVIVGGWAVAR